MSKISIQLIIEYMLVDLSHVSVFLVNCSYSKMTGVILRTRDVKILPNTTENIKIIFIWKEVVSHYFLKY